MLLLSVIRFVAPNQESIVYRDPQIGVVSRTATGPAGSMRGIVGRVRTDFHGGRIHRVQFGSPSTLVSWALVVFED